MWSHRCVVDLPLLMKEVRYKTKRQLPKLKLNDLSSVCGLLSLVLTARFVQHEALKKVMTLLFPPPVAFPHPKKCRSGSLVVRRLVVWDPQCTILTPFMSSEPIVSTKLLGMFQFFSQKVTNLDRPRTFFPIILEAHIHCFHQSFICRMIAINESLV